MPCAANIPHSPIVRPRDLQRKPGACINLAADSCAPASSRDRVLEIVPRDVHVKFDALHPDDVTLPTDRRENVSITGSSKGQALDTIPCDADNETTAWDADDLASGFVAEAEINDLAAGFEVNSTSSVPSDHSVNSATSPPWVDNPGDLRDGARTMAGNDPEAFDFDSGKDLICSQITLDSSNFREAEYRATEQGKIGNDHTPHQDTVP